MELLAAGETDETSLCSPALGWQAVVDRGARLMQTDNVQTMAAWRDGTDVTRLGLHKRSIRVQVEGYVNDPSASSDTDPHTRVGRLPSPTPPRRSGRRVLQRPLEPTPREG